MDYLCTCSRSFKIEDLFYCQQCQNVRCSLCVAQDIDSYYCPNCLENMASSEANYFSNSCKKCFECPCCFAALSFQTSSTSETDKSFFFSCGFCRWDSLGLNLVADSPNNLIAKLLEKEREGTEQKEVAKIVEKLQKEEREKAKEKRQLSRIRRSSLLFRTAPLPNISRPPPITLAELEKSLEAKEQSKLNKDTSVQEFDEDVYKEQELSQVSTLGQRLNALPGQSRDINSIYPRRKHLLTRRSKRCTVCDKVLIKPDLSPSKIEFKRQHMAIFYLPKVTIASISKISTYEISVLLKFTNPVHNLMHLNVGNYTGTAVKPIELSLPGPTFIAGKDFDEEDQDEEYKKPQE